MTKDCIFFLENQGNYLFNYMIIKENKTQDKPPPTPSIPGCGLIPGRAQIANSRGRSEVTFASQKSRLRRCCFARMCNQPNLGVFGSFVKIFFMQDRSETG